MENFLTQLPSSANYIPQRHTLTSHLNHLCQRKARHPKGDLESVKQKRLRKTRLFKSFIIYCIILSCRGVGQWQY